MRSWFVLSILMFSAPGFASGARWTDLARKVGSSETNRAGVIRELRKMPHLDSLVSQALTSKDRPLALEVICDLNLKHFVPRLLSLVSTDSDGFLTLAVNSMMDDKNRGEITRLYSGLLSSSNRRSPASIVAMLEPLGRLGTPLTRSQLLALKSSSSPEVRDGLLYYLRLISLHHDHTENEDLIVDLTHDVSRQVREHAQSVLAEQRVSRLAVTR